MNSAEKKLKPVKRTFLVTTEMHPAFNESMLHTALIGMMVNVVNIERKQPSEVSK